MSRLWRVSMLLSLLASLAPVDVRAQCEGRAYASTTETYREVGYCHNAKDALQWSLTIHCLDDCGEVWTTLPAQHGSADAACAIIPPQWCSPEWYRYSYTNGLYAESSAWNMKIFNGCKQDYQTIASGNCACAPSCAPREWPDPGPCATPVPDEASTLSIAGPPSNDPDLLQESLFSARMEEVDGVRYVMEDWAVVRLDGKRAPQVRDQRILASSSSKLRPKGTRVASLEPTRLGRPAGFELRIVAPEHPDNSRHIPTPRVALRPTTLPYLGAKVSAALRIDVGEDRRIRDSQVLFTTRELPGGVDLAEVVRSSLEVGFVSQKRHRLIVFAVVDVEAGSVRLRDSEVVLPLCCCNPLCK